jgi:hypothetical protein
MRHLKIAAFAFLAAFPAAGCTVVPGPYYREQVVVRPYYAQPYAYYAPPPVVYVEPAYPYRRYGRWR